MQGIRHGGEEKADILTQTRIIRNDGTLFSRGGAILVAD